MAVPQTSNVNDITTVIASLASRQSNRAKAKRHYHKGRDD